MEIKTDLRDDKVLFGKFANTKSRGKKIADLNMMGIYTVEDLINADNSIFTDLSRKTYVAIKGILTYEYVGGPFIYDEILFKTYDYSSGLYECAEDLATLGITNNVKETIRGLFMFTSGYSEKTISMKCVLKEIYSYRKDLARYYVSYIEDKENNKGLADLTQSITIQNLEVQLSTLESVLAELDKAINFDPSRGLFSFRQTLEIMIKEKRNELNNAKGKDYSRTR